MSKKKTKSNTKKHKQEKGSGPNGDSKLASGGELHQIAVREHPALMAGTPSVLFDAVAVILSDEGAKALSAESAAVDFVRDAMGSGKGRANIGMTAR